VGGWGLGLRAGIGMFDGYGSEGARLGLGVVTLGLGRHGGGVDGDGFAGSGRGGGVRVKGWGRGSVERGCGSGVELSWILENGRRVCSEHGKESGCGLDMDKWCGFGMTEAISQ